MGLLVVLAASVLQLLLMSQHLNICVRVSIQKLMETEVLVISLTPTWLLIHSNLIDVRVVEQPGRLGFSCLAPESGIRPPLVQSSLSLESFKSESAVKLDLDPVAKPTGSLGDSTASVQVRRGGGRGGSESAADRRCRTRVRQDQEPA